MIQCFLDLEHHWPVSVYTIVYYKVFYRYKYKEIVISPEIILERFNSGILTL